MDDLISRKAAIAEIENIGILDGYNDSLELIERIKKLPSGQPEIVRCEDCAYHAYDGYFDQHWCNHRDTVSRVKPNDFCSKGVRRDA